LTILALDGTIPLIAESVWVADSATVIGHVMLADNVSVWFGTVIRGDQPEAIRVGCGTNIQESCVLHSDAGVPLTIGANVTVGHRAVLHGCTIGDGSLIGIGAIVLNGAVIGKHCLVGAGALVTEGKQFPDGSLIVGSPAIVKRQLTAEQVAALDASAAHYVTNARRFKGSLRIVGCM